MTIVEYAPNESQILDFVNDGIRNLREGGMEAKYILLGSESYDLMVKAMSQRFNRSEGKFETYQFVPIVLDPSRNDTVCVLPGPVESKEVRIQRVPNSL